SRYINDNLTKSLDANDDGPTDEYMTYEPVNASKSGNKTGKEKKNFVGIPGRPGEKEEWKVTLLC
ncbi:28375_t:CDS:2, partial [Racocetra persica]